MNADACTKSMHMSMLTCLDICVGLQLQPFTPSWGRLPLLHMSAHVSLHTCLCTPISAHLSLHTCLYTHVFLCMHASTYMSPHECLYTHILQICFYTYVSTHVYALSTRLYTRLHTRLCILQVGAHCMSRQVDGRHRWHCNDVSGHVYKLMWGKRVASIGDVCWMSMWKCVHASVQTCAKTDGMGCGVL